MGVSVRSADSREAWRRVKQAVRAYVREPDEATAREVQDAWAEVRRISELVASRRSARDASAAEMRRRS
jgi:uncharacterized iron-regulated protein